MALAAVMVELIKPRVSYRLRVPEGLPQAEPLIEMSCARNTPVTATWKLSRSAAKPLAALRPKALFTVGSITGTSLTVARGRDDSEGLESLTPRQDARPAARKAQARDGSTVFIGMAMGLPRMDGADSVLMIREARW